MGTPFFLPCINTIIISGLPLILSNATVLCEAAFLIIKNQQWFQQKTVGYEIETDGSPVTKKTAVDISNLYGHKQKDAALVTVEQMAEQVVN